MAPEDQPMSAAGDWNILLYIFCSTLVIVGLTLLALLPMALCNYFRKPQKVNPPPTPILKRRESDHTVYPPTPHIIRLPKVIKDTQPDSPSVFDLEGSPYLWAQQPSGQELRMNPVILNPTGLASSHLSTDFPNSGLGHIILSLSDEKNRHVVRMPSFIEDLPSIHMGQPTAYTSDEVSVKKMNLDVLS